MFVNHFSTSSLFKTWLDFTGRPLEPELGDGWVQAVHPDDSDRCLHTYTEAFNRRESFEMHYRVRRKDGEYRWVSTMVYQDLTRMELSLATSALA